MAEFAEVLADGRKLLWPDGLGPGLHCGACERLSFPTRLNGERREPEYDDVCESCESDFTTIVVVVPCKVDLDEDLLSRFPERLNRWSRCEDDNHHFGSGTHVHEDAERPHRLIAEQRAREYEAAFEQRCEEASAQLNVWLKQLDNPPPCVRRTE